MASITTATEKKDEVNEQEPGQEKASSCGTGKSSCCG